jgi:hypothetical protein
LSIHFWHSFSEGLQEWKTEKDFQGMYQFQCIALGLFFKVCVELLGEFNKCSILHVSCMKSVLMETTFFFSYARWRYIVVFKKVPKIYQTYHTWIHPFLE